MCGNDEVGNDGHRLDLLRPRELDVLANAVRWLGRLQACVDATCWCWKDFTKRNLRPGGILWCKRLEVGSDEAAEE